MEIKRVACIGVGIIGHSWATLFAMKGLEVNLYDAQPLKAEEALQKIKANLDFLASKGYISRETALKAPENLKIFKSLEG
ncbi:MAG: 3-hydroxyacyl-CoA dehydrogenase NAD-binding domain-containing protein, partial [Candidatus Bathyarchaeia archaeon]